MSATQQITTADIQPLAHSTSLQEIPFFSCRIAAGFASPADDHLDNPIDLNQMMVPTPAATFMLKVEGESDLVIWGCVTHAIHPL